MGYILCPQLVSSVVCATGRQEDFEGFPWISDIFCPSVHFAAHLRGETRFRPFWGCLVFEEFFPSDLLFASFTLIHVLVAPSRHYSACIESGNDTVLLLQRTCRDHSSYARSQNSNHPIRFWVIDVMTSLGLDRYARAKMKVCHCRESISSVLASMSMFHKVTALFVLIRIMTE